MKRTALFIVAAALTVAIVALSVRAARDVGLPAAEWSRVKLGELDVATRERLGVLDGDVLITWYGSSRERMPSAFRHVEDDVALLFGVLQAQSHGRITTAIVHPDLHPELADHFASLSLAPFRARRIERDGYVEEEVWSALRIAHAVKGSSTIPALEPDALPHLQSLVLAHLDELERPSRPRVLVSAPESWKAVFRAVASEAELVESDFETSARLDDGAHVFLWIDPSVATPAHLAALHAFLDRGKSAVIAGSTHAARVVGGGGAPALAWTRTAFPADALLGEFGLSAAPEIALDLARGTEGDVPAGDGRAFTSHVVAIGSSQDFRGFSSSPNGTLLFDAPMALVLDGARLSSLGLRARVLATSAESTWLEPFPSDPLPIAARDRGALADPAPHLPLVVRLAPDDPWRGDLVFCAASTPFSDAYLKHEAFAHSAFLRTLVGELASLDRRARQRVALERPAPIAEPSRAERWTWRALVVLAAPGALGLFAFVRRRSRRGPPRGETSVRGETPAHGRRFVPAALVGAVALAALAIAGRAISAIGGRGIDLTAARSNALKPETIARFHRGAPVEIETCFSPDDRLPAELRRAAEDVRAIVRELARSVDGVRVTEHRLADLSPAEAADWERRGVRPVRVTSMRDEATLVRKVYSAVLVRRGDREERIELPDAKSTEHFEFRLDFALARLERGRGVRVAWAADRPMLAPAEAKLEYQDHGLFAPSEGDVYALARRALERNDFEVVAVDPRAPRVPSDVDLVTWIQPRRDIAPMERIVVERLAKGGKAIVAAQHHVVRSQRRAARDLALSLWPEPQYCDLDTSYFARVGVELVREILLDELHGAIAVDTRVDRGTGVPSIEREEAASPVFVQALAPRAAAPLARGVGEALFSGGNRVRLDAARLAEYGLAAEPYLWSSPRTWSYAWTGGPLPDLAPPADARAFVGAQPLAVRVHGSFPAADDSLAPLAPRTPGATAESAVGGDAPKGAPDGELVLIGCSEMFRNDRIELERYDHERLLLDAVVATTLGPELTSVLSARGESARVGLVAPRDRALLRAAVVGCAPLSLLVFGIVWRTWRRRAPIER